RSLLTVRRTSLSPDVHNRPTPLFAFRARQAKLRYCCRELTRAQIGIRRGRCCATRGQSRGFAPTGPLVPAGGRTPECHAFQRQPFSALFLTVNRRAGPP